MMKKLLITLSLIALAFSSFFGTQKKEVELIFHTDIDAAQASELIQENLENEDFVILDVRSPSEFKSGHIPGAVNINYYDSDFEAQLDELDKDKVYLVYCRSGGRSSNALKKMIRLEFKRVYHLKKGYNSWKNR